jgi:predicted CopG family antitoxin
MNYKLDIRKDAIDFLKVLEETAKKCIINGKPFDCFDIESAGSNFRTSIINHIYTSEDALFILKNTDHEETQSELWEGKHWASQLSTRAAYSFVNDVVMRSKETYDDISRIYKEEYHDLSDLSPEEKVNSIWTEYFDQFIPNVLQHDSPEELTYIKEWIRFSDGAGICGSYPVGHAHIQFGFGYGYGMPSVKDYVDHDNLAWYLVPWMIGKTCQEVRDRISQLEETDGTTTIQLARSTKNELDSLKDRTSCPSFNDVIIELLKLRKSILDSKLSSGEITKEVYDRIIRPKTRKQQFTYEYIRAFNEKNIPQTYIGKSISFYITTCTPIDEMLIDEIRSDLKMEVKHGIVPDRLILDTQTYIENKEILNTIINIWNKCIDAIDGIQDNVSDNVIPKEIFFELRDTDDEIVKITKEILQDILDMYLP